jgi:hypothetical protein
MMLAMARLAKPADIKRFVVIVVVGDRLRIAARFARLALQDAVSDSPGDGTMGNGAALVLRPPCPRNLNRLSNTALGFSSLPVIGANLLNVFVSMFCCVMLATLLAFIEIPVAHRRMLVELIDGFDGLALKTLF